MQTAKKPMQNRCNRFNKSGFWQTQLIGKTVLSVWLQNKETSKVIDSSDVLWFVFYWYNIVSISTVKTFNCKFVQHWHSCIYWLL